MACCLWEEGHMEKAGKGVAWLCIFSLASQAATARQQ